MKRVVVVLIAAACASTPKAAETPRSEATSTEIANQSQPAAAASADATGVIGSCERPDPLGPFQLSGEDMLKRRGLGDRLFSDTVSTAEAPIQVCGVGGELTWLTNVTCADGSRPFGRDLRKAHAARTGSFAGRRACGSRSEEVSVDHYEVPCPEKRYDVYMDMYECGPGERFP